MPFLFCLVAGLEGVQLDLNGLWWLLLGVLGAGELSVFDAESPFCEVLCGDVLIGVVAVFGSVCVPVFLAAAGLGVRVPPQQVDGLPHFPFWLGPAHV